MGTLSPTLMKSSALKPFLQGCSTNRLSPLGLILSPWLPQGIDRLTRLHLTPRIWSVLVPWIKSRGTSEWLNLENNPQYISLIFLTHALCTLDISSLLTKRFVRYIVVDISYNRLHWRYSMLMVATSFSCLPRTSKAKSTNGQSVATNLILSAFVFC